jgi:hypothetical protein
MFKPPRYNVSIDIHDNELDETIADSGFNTANLLIMAQHLENIAKRIREREKRRREDVEMLAKHEKQE